MPQTIHPQQLASSTDSITLVKYLRITRLINELSSTPF